ncbi:unnamed protein product, partial [marine sediment metagenome]
TGIAATHMNGVTIHSWAGLGIKNNLSDDDLDIISRKRYLIKRFAKTKVLIVDEVSMLHDFRLDMVDAVCKMFKQSLQPFGGMQVVLCGDFFQLPPINKTGEGASFIDKSQVWQNMGLKICYLDEQYRHCDSALMQILNDIRANNVGEHTLEPLRKRYKTEIQGSMGATKLYTHNIDVDLINNRELKKLQGETKRYYMASKGNRKLVESLKRACLASEELQLKKNTKVMFVKNNFNKGYVNGTLGRVVAFDYDDMPIVK